jgi:DNA-binding response OmpR family regulator
MNILLIEDELFLVKLYLKVLTDAGHVVDSAVDGQQALAQASEKKYDLMLVDLMIPYIPGSEVLRQIRADVTNPNQHTAAWITTNYEPTEEDKAEMLTLAQDFIIKAEITPRQLSEMITERLTGSL